MKASVLILHGYTGKPDGHWLPWLDSELTKQGAVVERPLMPDPDDPEQTLWLKVIDEFVRSANEPIVLVGHSLGALAILRYLENVPPKQIKAAMIVAAPTDWKFQQVRHPGIHDFFAKGELDYKSITANVDIIEAFYSVDDESVKLFEGERLRDATGAVWHEYADQGHFCERDGLTEFPELRDRILAACDDRT